MNEFQIHTPESAPDGSSDALRRIERNVGFIPNLAATIAGAPAAIEGFVGAQTALRGSRLSGAEREVVGLTVSFENGARYSMAAHSTFALAVGAPDEVVAALRAGAELPDPRLQTLHAFTRAVVRSSGHVHPEIVDAFFRAGYSPGCALEVIAQVAYTTFANYAANIAETPVDTPFAAQKWERLAGSAPEPDYSAR